MADLFDAIDELEAAGVKELQRIFTKTGRYLEQVMGPFANPITIFPMELPSKDYVKIPATFFGMPYAIHVYRDPERADQERLRSEAERYNIIGHGTIDDKFGYILKKNEKTITSPTQA